MTEKIKAECPRVVWKESFAALGRFDVVDVIESADIKEVEKAAMIIRAYGHSTTETLLATPWKEFLGMLWDGQYVELYHSYIPAKGRVTLPSIQIPLVNPVSQLDEGALLR